MIVDKLVDEAVEAELESPLADDLRVLVHEYEDVWRLRIGADAPARACAALPVRKAWFRITVDCRPVNKLDVPLAGATPNLADVTQSVRGTYEFGQFDLFKCFGKLALKGECHELLSL